MSSNRDKLKQAGKELFMLYIPSGDIARILDVSATTVSNWTKADDWHKERATKSSARKTIQDSILFLIDYQLEVLTDQVNEAREKGGKLKLIDKGEIDALTKMFATIKGKELVWANVVTVIREFVEYLGVKDQDLAKVLIPHTDDFLNTKREQMTV